MKIFQRKLLLSHFLFVHLRHIGMFFMLILFNSTETCKISDTVKRLQTFVYQTFALFINYNATKLITKQK